MAEEEVKLKCQDGQVLCVGVESAKMSTVIGELIEDGTDDEIPVKVNKDILEKVMEFCSHIRTNEAP